MNVENAMNRQLRTVARPTWWRGALVASLVVLCAASSLPAERLKDIADVKGVRGNPLWGYGLVVGLNGTGDDSEVSRRALANILRRSGLVLKPEDLNSKNIASVVVTAELAPFARKGSKIDITVSAIGDATSLQGGTLLITPLAGADGEVYAVAQGALSIGGFAAGGKNATVSKNHVTVGRVPSGATVEREELADFVEKGRITWTLRNPDFATADRTAKAINKIMPDAARALDAGSVGVTVGEEMTFAQVVAAIRRMGAVEVEVDSPAVVVINERTGTIVVGQNVSISLVAISHGSLSIIKQERERVSQPAPFSRVGATATVNRTSLTAEEGGGSMQVVDRSISVAELARALNALGLTPRDLVSIFEALKEAGALQATLKVI